MVRGQWYNSDKHKVSYLRNYKSASSSIVKVLECEAEYKPRYSFQFTYFRCPYERARSAYMELRRQGNISHLAAFEEYLLHILDFGFWNKHQFPQWYLIKDYPEVDIYKDINIIWDFLNITDIPWENKSPKIFEISEREAELIDILYKKDIEIWNT